MNWWVLLPTVIGLVVGIIGYLMKRSINEMDKKIDQLSIKADQTNARLERSFNELRKEFYDYKDKAADEFVKKADFVLVTSDISKKLDRVYDILLDLKGRVNR